MRLRQTIIKFLFILPYFLVGHSNVSYAQNINDYKKTAKKKTASKKTTCSPKPIKADPKDKEINGHEYVDLGLPSGTKWATCNIGASTPWDYGNYYAWGEVTSKFSYNGLNSLTKGKSIQELQSEGIINSEGILTISHDTANAHWGGTWRMPTASEFNELRYECTWTPTTLEGHNGYKVTGPNGKTLFLPAAGWRIGESFYYVGENGYYWTSSLYYIYNQQSVYSYYSDYDDKAMIVISYNINVLDNLKHSLDSIWRSYGCTIRPISQ